MCETWAHISFWGPGNILWPQKKRNKKAVRERSQEPRVVGGDRPLTLPKPAKGMRKNAQHKWWGTEREQERVRGNSGGIGGRGGGYGQSNSQTAAEMYNKTRRQRAAEGRVLRWALKMQHYVYAVVHRQKSQTTDKPNSNQQHLLIP